MLSTNNKNKQLTFSLNTDIRSIEKDWDLLAKQRESCQFYQQPAWYKSFAHILTDNIYYIAIYNQNTINGIIPIEYKIKKQHHINIRIIRFPCHLHINLSDCLINDSIKDVVLEQLPEFLNQHFRWDILDFYLIPKESDTENLILQIHHSNHYAKQVEYSSYIDCKETIDATLSHLSSKFRRNVFRLERKAEKLGKLEFLSVHYDAEHPEEFEDYYQSFLDIEADSWKSRTHTAIKCNEKLIHLYQNLYKNFNGAHHVVINFLKIDDQLIAAQYGIFTKNKLNLLKIGFREEFKHIGPGNILLLYTLKQCIENGITRLSTVTAPEWAEKWKTDSIPLYQYRIFNTTIRSSIIHFLFIVLQKLKKH